MRKLIALTFVGANEALEVSIATVITTPDKAAAKHLAVLVVAHSHTPAKRRVVHSVRMAAGAVIAADVETVRHARARAIDDRFDHLVQGLGQRDAAAVCVLGHDVADQVGGHVRPVACEVLADGCHQRLVVAVTPVHRRLFIACIGQPVRIGKRLVRPLKDDALPVGGAVQREHVLHSRVQLVPGVLLDEPRPTLVGLHVVSESVGQCDPLEAITPQDADGGLDPRIPERTCLDEVGELVA